MWQISQLASNVFKVHNGDDIKQRKNEWVGRGLWQEIVKTKEVIYWDSEDIIKVMKPGTNGYRGENGFVSGDGIYKKISLWRELDFFLW